jgi:hypothetical protein
MNFKGRKKKMKKLESFKDIPNEMKEGINKICLKESEIKANYTALRRLLDLENPDELDLELVILMATNEGNNIRDSEICDIALKKELLDLIKDYLFKNIERLIAED